MTRVVVAATLVLAAGAAAFVLPGMSRAVAQTVKFTHVVVVVQENRTVDNLFGSNPSFEPGVDIATSGINSAGKTIPLTGVALTGCYDLGHSHRDWVKMYAGGTMTGADRVEVQPVTPTCVPPPNAQFKFVDNATGAVQPYFDIATSFGFANRMFQTNQGPSFPAHQFIFAGTSAPTTKSPLFAAENMIGGGKSSGCTAPPSQRVAVIDPNGSEKTHPPVYPCLVHPAISDLLDAAGLSWKYYTPKPSSNWTAPNAIKHICHSQQRGGTQVCTGRDWLRSVVVQPNGVFADIAACQLANVSWVIPSAQESDHARVNKGTGPDWVASIVNAIGSNPACAGGEKYWNDTAILITWDDWGGWYDHVPPFRIGQPNGWGTGYAYGFRVPLLVVSAFTHPGYVDNTNLDFGALLRFIEVNFGLGTIGPGFYADAYSAQPLAGFFDRVEARGFKPIKTTLSIEHFRALKEPLIGPDEDDD